MLLKAALDVASPAGRRGKLSVLVFHRVLAERDPLFSDQPDISRFDDVVGWMNEWFEILPLHEAVSRLRRGGLPARAAAITFDDGYADNLLHAVPVLRKHGVHATFFIATGFIGRECMWNDTIIESVRRSKVPAIDCRFIGLNDLVLERNDQKRSAIEQLISAVKYLPLLQRTEAVAQIADRCSAQLPQDLMLTLPQLRELHSAGMGIGAHTVSHPILAMLDERSARKEIADSRDFLVDALGEPVGLFAYPNGKSGVDYTHEHSRIVKSLGFEAAFATNWGVGRTTSDIYQLPRFTPWDASRLRFGLRLLMNAGRRDVAVPGARPPGHRGQTGSGSQSAVPPKCR
jgi:peptidoglycan/xylan/chitin deacetylase (PgdA/CDA1 family)